MVWLLFMVRILRHFFFTEKSAVRTAQVHDSSRVQIHKIAMQLTLLRHPESSNLWALYVSFFLDSVVSLLLEVGEAPPTRLSENNVLLMLVRWNMVGNYLSELSFENFISHTKFLLALTFSPQKF